MYIYIVASLVNTTNSACRSPTRSICQIQLRVCDIHWMATVSSHMRAPIRAASRRVASRHIFHGRADGRPCSMYISIPPLRGVRDDFICKE